MKLPTPLYFAAAFLVPACLACSAEKPVTKNPPPSEKNPPLIIAPDAGFQQRLAGREIRRYTWLRTGEWLSLGAAVKFPASGDAIIIADKTSRILQSLPGDERLKESIATLQPQEYLLRTVAPGKGQRAVLVVGGDAIGALYGAYRLIEHSGVRFYLHGDVIPEEQVAFRLPEIDEVGKPLFALRGLNPWGSHVEGIDVWNADDWKRVFTQMTKQRMNFLGVHSYPEHPKENGQYGSESTVWIGRPEDCAADGSVTASFPSSLYNTLRSQWGHRPKPTGEYGFGASLLFEHDAWGPDSMIGHCPLPTTPEGCNEVFNRTGAMQREAFALARLLGIKTCLGTESPLTIPRAVKARLVAEGKDPAAPAVIKDIYKGIFTRIARTHPLDYYWIWTPERWLWSLNSEKETKAFCDDIAIAIEACKEIEAPFELATAGWVLGPVEDRAALDRILPPGMPVSALSEAYTAPVDPAFAQIAARPKWAIPWIEEDSGILGPQLWVSRVRKDAADALAYRCDGLMGLLWRTRPTGPACAALARAAWSQDGWNPEAGNDPPGVPASLRFEGVLPPYGRSRSETYKVDREVSRTSNPILYRTGRRFLRGYRLKVPAGRYRVTLMFCEAEHGGAGERVFDLKLQDRVVTESLDVCKQVGRHAALELSFDDVVVSESWLDVILEPKVGQPCISGIAITGDGFTRKINCGGPAFKDFEGDPPRTRTMGWGPKGTAHGPRGLPCDDFYRDWAIHHFGAGPGPAIGKLFAKLDGRVPLVSSFDGGAGALWPDQRPWKAVAPEFGFIEQFEALDAQVRGIGNRERYNYWLDTFRHLRAQAKVCCTWSLLNQAMENRDVPRSLALRKDLTRHMGEAYRHLLATVSTPGGMATVLNWENHVGRRRLIDPTDEKLAELLGRGVPAECLPPREYNGPPRLIVPTVRTQLCPGEDLNLKVIALANPQPDEIHLRWRALGTDAPFATVPARHLARGVYRVVLPADDLREDFEYHLAMEVEGERIVFPSTAPTRNQTVVVP